MAIFLRRESRRRNAGRGDDWTDPTDDEITKCLDDRWRDSDELLEDVFVNLHVTDQEIRDALESGEEVSSSTPPNHIYSSVGRFFVLKQFISYVQRLNVFSMRCVGFDTALVEFIMAEHSKLPAFQKEPGLMARTRKRRATTSSSSGNVHLCGPRRKKQRFNGQTDFDSDDDDGSEYDASTKCECAELFVNKLFFDQSALHLLTGAYSKFTQHISSRIRKQSRTAAWSPIVSYIPILILKE